MRMLVLWGIAVVVAGFVLRINPLLVILAAALTTGVLAAVGPGVGAGDLWRAGVATLAAFGKAFNENRYLHVVWLVLPVIGLVERAGMQERARTIIAGVKAATAGGVLVLYLAIRQVTAALGLTTLGGHPQMVRPLIAPMAEAAAEASHGDLSDKDRYRVRSFAAATDNVGLFFGEDFFVAIGSILLIVGFLEQSGIKVTPAELAVWALPTAAAAFVIHAARLVLFERSLGRRPPTPAADAQAQP
jgi:uncharacterized membrane protein